MSKAKKFRAPQSDLFPSKSLLITSGAKFGRQKKEFWIEQMMRTSQVNSVPGPKYNVSKH